MAANHSFGPFRLDARTGILFRGSEPMALGQRAVALLQVLLERPGVPVSKDDLIAAAWSGVAIEESNLPVQIAALRRALRVEPNGEHWIETLPRRGYRFIGPVVVERQSAEESASDTAEASVSVTASAAAQPSTPLAELALPDRPSVAVLPFLNIGGDPEQEYFADGVVEDIIIALSHVKSLFVIARNSSFTYKGRSVDVKQVGRELGVRYVLEGSVRKSSNRVRITAQLVDTTTGTHLWADRLDSLLDDIFALQDEVTGMVIGAIEPSLRGAEIERAQRKPTKSLHAYDLMLRAMAHIRSYDRTVMEDGVQLLREALAADPKYAMANATLAHTIHLMNSQGWLSRPDPEIDEGIQLARLAVRLGEADPEVLATSALTIALPGGDQAGGLALADKALLLNRNSTHALSVNAIIFAFRGEMATSIASAERFARLSPFDNAISLRRFSRALAHFVAGEYDATLDWTEETLRDVPTHGASLRYRAASFGLLDRLDEGKIVARQLLSARPNFSVSRARAHLELDLRNPFKDRNVAETLYEGLRRVGIPE